MRAIEFLYESAVADLADKLPNLKRVDYNAIDALMKRVSSHHGIDRQQLHQLFAKKYGHSPDTWIKKYQHKLKEADNIPAKDDDSMGYMKYFNKPPEQKKPQEKRFHGWDEYEKEKEHVAEGIDSTEDMEKVKHFIEWTIKTLNIQKPYPKLSFSRDTKQAQKDHRTGVHTDAGEITIYIENRNLIDIFRTVFHEFVHHRQDQLNMIKDGDSYPGSPIEAMADMMAGKYIKIYGKQHPEIFQ